MFKKNDKSFFNAITLIKVILIIYGVLLVAGFITFCCLAMVGYAFALLISGVLSIFVLWVMYKLLFSFLCDVKFIRNKLYDCDNSNLSEYFDNPQEVEKRERNISALKTLFLKGLLTEEEYQNILIETEDKEVSADIPILQMLLQKGVISSEEYEAAINGKQ